MEQILINYTPTDNGFTLSIAGGVVYQNLFHSRKILKYFTAKVIKKNYPQTI